MKSEINESTLQKLKKLMVHEQSCRKIGNLEEATVYASKIAALCLRYKVELAEVKIDEASTPRAVDDVDRAIVNSNTAPGFKWARKRIWWQETLAMGVSECTSCKLLVRTGSNVVTFVGAKCDREVAVYLFTFLLDFISRESQKAYDQNYYARVERDGEHPEVMSGYKHSWIVGALHALNKRFREMKKEVQHEVGEAKFALIVRSSALAIEKWMENQKIKTADDIGGNTYAYNGAGYSSGHAAGSNVGLNRPIAGASSTVQQIA